MITDIKVMMFERLSLIKLTFSSLPEAKHFVLWNCLAIWHSFPDIVHLKVNINGRKSAILNLMKLIFFQGILLPESAHFVGHF